MSRRIPRIQRCAETHIQPRAASKFLRLILTSSISELLTSQEKHAQQQRRLYRYLERVVRSEYQSCVTTFDWLATQMPEGSLDLLALVRSLQLFTLLVDISRGALESKKVNRYQDIIFQRSFLAIFNSGLFIQNISKEQPCIQFVPFSPSGTNNFGFGRLFLQHQDSNLCWFLLVDILAITVTESQFV